MTHLSILNVWRVQSVYRCLFFICLGRVYCASLATSPRTMSVVVLALCVTISALLYYLSVRKFSYWRNKNVPHLKPLPLLGNYGEYILMKKYVGHVSQEMCRKFSKEPYFGAFYGTEPTLVIQDPEIIKLVFTKDFYYFHSREIAKYTPNEVTTQNLFFTQGDKWKVVRQNLTPLFTSAKMKNMFYLVGKCGHTLEKLLDEETAMSGTVEAKSLMIKYTMDCIGSCVFGIETGAMEITTEKNVFVTMGEIIFNTSKFHGYKLVCRAIWPKIFYALGFKYYSTEIDIFFKSLLMSVFEKRNFKPTARHDFVDLVLALKQKNHIIGDSLNSKSMDNKKIEMKVTDDLLVSQCIVFFAAGFETSASTLSCALYELAKNQEAQRRAQEEVDEYLRRRNNKLVYECVTELPYIEACLNETMRLYPVLPVITREVVEDYTFPSGLQVDKGVRVHLPVYHLHRRPEYFPEPDSFHPERLYGDARMTSNPTHSSRSARDRGNVSVYASPKCRRP
ncbi:hypothetical protein O3G_MSEX014398 [Manduca sexta]|uniref:unspecific monooxygenase n=1 Tax=Manduca sexta TaxID=7130 RepID=A0A922CZK4_MANSE|nr:hypothetical protein O3G_MSEX014398 [Manduca sexta]KAG6464273.1 hypothetical protein O3G_MSEX014398 [Manduca sexta]